MGSLGHLEEEPTMASKPLVPVEPILFINGKRHVLPDGYAEATLLEYLREIGLVGTKLGCGEGGCGACTVMVSHFDHAQKKIIHRSVNACLAPLYSVEGTHVVTVEGIGSRRTGLHPVQERLSTSHGSQCGFCTPGFVMSMYTMLRAAAGPLTEHDIEEGLAGNLCRCTGYRPILDAFRVFAKSDAAAYTGDALAAGGAAPAPPVARGAAICPSTGRPCDCGGSDGLPNKQSVESAAAVPNGAAGGLLNGLPSEASDWVPTPQGAAAGGRQHEGWNNSGLPVGEPSGAPNGTAELAQKSRIGQVSKEAASLSDPRCGVGACECLGGCQAHGADLRGTSPAAAKASPSEPIFPPELRSRAVGPLVLRGKRGTTWYRPTSLQQLLELRGAHPQAKLVVGNSEVGIEMKLKGLPYNVLVATTAVEELNGISATEQGLHIGAAATLTNLMAAMRAAMEARPAHETRSCAAIVEQLRWFAGNQIRNVASVGGNICTASPISDLNPLWVACGATFTVLSAGSPSRQVAADKFFLGYRKVDLKEGEILGFVDLPWTRAHEYAKDFKQAHRRDDDIAIVNAGMRARFEEREGTWAAAEVAISYGGVAALTVSASKTAEFMVGKPWTQATLDGALDVLKGEIIIVDTAPGGMPEFRRSLTASFLFKFFLHASFQLEKEANFAHGIPDEYRSATSPFERPPSHGMQYYESSPDGGLVGAPVQHMSADLQVSGEAQYADDIPLPAFGLHGYLVLSTKPHANILGIDLADAEAAPGFVAFFSAKDVPGHNETGAVLHDEEVFASKKVTCVGQVIGFVVADTHENARAASRKVKVEYEELPALFSIDDAIEAGSFCENPDAPDRLELRQERGDVDAAFAGGECTHVLEGRVRVGGQEQFYLECNSVLAWPTDGGAEMHVVASTQAPTHTQKDVALVLGLPLHKVVCKTKRIGGGFGGKETRSVLVASAAAVAAAGLQRAMRCTLDRDTDMCITGQRHPFLGVYKVGFTEEGRLVALDLKLYNNGGNSCDLSHSVLGRALFHCDNVYAVPHLRVAGRIAKTNLPSNTAFRGFGAPQGMMVAENIVERIARAVGRPVEAVRELNMQRDGYELHYGQVFSPCHLQRMWSELLASSDFEARRAAVDAFNRAHRWRKRGLAAIPTKYGISFTTKFLNQGGALVHVYTDGTVLVTHGGVEMGQGLHTKVAQVAAATLGVPLTSVFIAETSTDKVPNTSPTASSTSSDIYGAATRNACLELVKRMQPMREQMGPDATFQEVVSKCYFERIDLSAHGFYVTADLSYSWKTGKGAPFAYYTQGAAVSEVEIDTLTGDTSFVRSDIVMDLGRSLNPAIDVGQIEGAFVQGLGWAVTEELKWGDREHPWIRPGHLFTQGPGAYKIPAVADIPVDFRVSLLKGVDNPRALLSSKAVGEPPLFLAASAMFAIKEAIYAARRDEGLDGWFPLDSPATPERIRVACADRFTAGVAPDLRPKLSV